MENLAKCYQREVLKREFWDSMQVKGKAIKVSGRFYVGEKPL